MDVVSYLLYAGLVVAVCVAVARLDPESTGQLTRRLGVDGVGGHGLSFALSPARLAALL